MYVTSGFDAQPQASAHINTRVLPRAVGSPACRDLTLQGFAPCPFCCCKNPRRTGCLTIPSAQGRYCEPGLCLSLNPHGTWIKETQLSAPLHSCQW